MFRSTCGVHGEALEYKIGAMNETARGRIMVFRCVEKKREEELRARIEEDLSPEMMFNCGTALFPSLWTYMKTFLGDRGAQIRIQQRNQTVFTIANTICTEPENKSTAKELSIYFLSEPIYSSSSPMKTEFS